MLTKKIEEIKAKFLLDIKKAATEQAIFDVKVKYLGRKGKLTEILKGLKDLDAGGRKTVGPLANQARQEIENQLTARKKELSEKIDWEKEKIDVTLPGKKVEIGHLSPIALVQRDIENIFFSMGFEIADGPEIETEWYNFDALNIPENHPARDSGTLFGSKYPKHRKISWLCVRTHLRFRSGICRNTSRLFGLSCPENVFGTKPRMQHMNILFISLKP